MHKGEDVDPNTCLLCSTPFGDIDQCTPRTFVAEIPGKKCSTPFGDIDQCTGTPGTSSAGSTSAQRLSATLINAQAEIRPEHEANWACSTPFGDIDQCTSWYRGTTVLCAGAQRLSATLINARRYPMGTPRSLPCAQRLSATLINAPCRSRPYGRAPSGAQRLSATLINALEPQHGPVDMHSVLNAFRRH